MNPVVHVLKHLKKVFSRNSVETDPLKSFYSKNPIEVDGLVLFPPRIEPSGLIKINGRVIKTGVSWKPIVSVNGSPLPLKQEFRRLSSKIEDPENGESKIEALFRDITYVFQIPEDLENTEYHFEIYGNNRLLFKIDVQMSIPRMHYAPLLDTPYVLSRSQIYGTGPPSLLVSDDILRICSSLKGPVLDFGCGSGALIALLQNSGIEAYGIEIEQNGKVRPIIESVKKDVLFYDGRLPLPFEDNQFESVTALEVLEHVTALEKVLAELARLSRSTFLVSVPDVSAISMNCNNRVVPWHLLESSHINFFSPASLKKMLAPLFTEIVIGKIIPLQTNAVCWHESIVAYCRKHPNIPGTEPVV